MSMLKKLGEYEDERRRLKEGGGQKAIEKQHNLGKLTARERIERLLDPGTFQELGIWDVPVMVGFDIDKCEAPGDGVITGYGEVNGRRICVYAQDATVLGGTVAATHARKIVMLMEMSLKARVPIVALLDSEGIRMEDAMEAHGFYSYAAITQLQTLCSGLIPQISLVMGPCVGEAAISVGLSDFIFMVKNTSYMHIAPAPPGITSEELGGPKFHSRVSACCDVVAENDDDCLQKAKDLLSFLPLNSSTGTRIVDTTDEPGGRDEELLEIVPVERSKWYDMRKITRRLADGNHFFELKSEWAKNLVTGFARLGGQTVGITANNPMFKSGCLCVDSSDKLAHFVRFCDAFNIPLVYLCDNPAYLPAVDEEQRGIIRHGSHTIMANVEASVPKIHITIRKNYGGGGNLGMPGLTLGTDIAIAWPTYDRGAMGEEGAISILYKKEIEASKNPEELLQRKKEELSVKRKNVERIAVQDFIDPRETRPFLIKALKMLAGKNEERPWRKHDNFTL